MKRFITLLLATGTLVLSGCSDIQGLAKTKSPKVTIESVLAQRVMLKQNAQIGLLSGQRIAALMAIDVQNCPADFRSAWFDYLVEVQNLHRRMERVAGIGLAMGKPVKGLPSLIAFVATSPDLEHYLLAALDEEDKAWNKVERTAMNYGVMPKMEVIDMNLEKELRGR